MAEIKEKYLETSPIPVSIKGTETIINQMKNGIFKIYTKNGTKGNRILLQNKQPNKN